MSDTFTLRIDLGNDEMRSKEDVALALTRVGGLVAYGERAGAVRDANGNTVGRWTFDSEDTWTQ